MTTISSKQQDHQITKATTSLEKTQQRHSKTYPFQEQALGSHQQQSLSSHYTSAVTTKQAPICDSPAITDSITLSSSSENGVVDKPSLTDDDDDDDDVEIIMHDSDNLFNDTDPALGTRTSCHIRPPSSTASYQQRQQFDSSPPQIPTGSKCQLLQRQLEYYFSRQNLINDTYLVSQMDPDLFVPIATIAKFKRVMTITSDMDFIISALRRSSLVTVNDSNTMVKPNILTQRTTVILRDVPEATDKEIKQFLAELKSPPVKELKKEYASMWYVTFDSEEDALKMLHDSRGKLFKGQYVAARMKFESLVGSIQAQRSALQTGSAFSTSPSVNITTSTHSGQNQHITSNYNRYYSGYNDHGYHYNTTHMNDGNQYPMYHTNQPDNIYSHHYTNDYGKGYQRGGNRYMDNNSSKQSAKGYVNNNNNSSSNSNSAWTNRHHWRPKSHRQQHQTIYRANQTASFSTLNNGLPDIDSTVLRPIYSSSPSPFGKNSRSKSYNGYRRDQRDGKATHWIQKQQYKHQDPSFIEPTEYNPPAAPTMSFQVWRNDSTTQVSPLSTSPEPKNSLSASSSRRSSVTKVVEPTTSSSSSSSETVSIINVSLSPMRSPSSATTSDITDSLETQDAKSQQKPKWNKRKNKNSVPHSLDGKNHSHQGLTQSDIQSSIYFPPLPISNNSNVSQTAVSPITTKLEMHTTSAVTDNHQQQHVLTADIVKEGPAANDGSNNYYRGGGHDQKTNDTVTADGGGSDTSAGTKQPQRSEDTNNDPFPRLCPMQENSRPTASLSYADMLMKNDKEIKMVVL